MRIFIDPGHGGVWRPNPPKGDPGVVSPDGKKIESNYTWLYSLKLREILSNAGFDVVLTREHNEHTITNRTRGTTPEDLFISIHFDTYLPGGRKMIYYAGLKNDSESKRFARVMDEYLKTGNIQPSTNSRFGRLYIDDAKCPAILIEVDKITDADDSEETMVAFSNKVLDGIRRYVGKFSTPFQRVFLIENDVQRQLEIERMSIVGDKLYIVTKKGV